MAQANSLHVDGLVTGFLFMVQHLSWFCLHDSYGIHYAICFGISYVLVLVAWITVVSCGMLPFANCHRIHVLILTVNQRTCSMKCCSLVHWDAIISTHQSVANPVLNTNNDSRR
ncbi:unnamed protein product [Lathyrus oleraceus]